MPSGIYSRNAKLLNIQKKKKNHWTYINSEDFFKNLPSQLMQKKHLTEANTLSWLKKKNTQKLGKIKGNFLKVIDCLYKNSTDTTTLNGKRLKVFFWDEEQDKDFYLHFYATLY